MAETIHSRQNTMFNGSQVNRSITNFGIDQRSLSSIELSPSRDQRQISKINIEFGGKRNLKVASREEATPTVDMVDAAFKINTFLNKHLCLFTQGLTYKNKNIKGYLDVLSMECSVIPLRCRGPYYNLIGYFYSMLDKFEKAEKYFEMALKINADDTVACVNKARNYLKNNEIMKIHPVIRRLKDIEARSSHVPGLSPLSAANNTIALSYNKLGLSCAALKHYDAALKADPLNFDCYLGKGEVLVRLSKHQGRANALKTLNEGVKCLRKYIAEYNVLNLAKEKDPRESPLPRDNKAVNNVYAVILLARALNERSRRLEKEYTQEALDYLDLALGHCEGSVYTLYQIGDEKRLMNYFDGEESALNLLKKAIEIRESSLLYHSYALAILKWERLKYEERFRAVSNMTTATSHNGAAEHDSAMDNALEQQDHQLDQVKIGVDKAPATPLAPPATASFGGTISKLFPIKRTLGSLMLSSANALQEQRKKSIKHHSSKSDKPKPFVFEGDNELQQGFIRVAKLLKHALKLSPVGSTQISLDLAEIYCSLNRKSEAESMFNNILESSNPVDRELAYRKFGRFLIKIGNFPRGDEMIEEAIKLRSHANHDEVALKQLEETVTILAEHFKSDNATREKFWMDQLLQINPTLAEDPPTRNGPKSSRQRGK
ncbi:uncharacterized protein LOC134818116 [Bolinopsis microptera]|uniref:uncharacterized protein LOC134818116 n=1 Tax=Bolinopsis microptera TaxID=2820187 RepID=UPI003079A10D